MDTYLLGVIVKTLEHGDFTNMVGYVLIFAMLSLQLRFLKKEVRKLNETIANAFAAGETRFASIEIKQLNFEHRLSMLESQPKGI